MDGLFSSGGSAFGGMDSSGESPGDTGVVKNVICFAGNVTYSCFDDDLNSTHVTPQRWMTSDEQSGMATAIVLLIYVLIGLPLNLFIVVSMLWKKLYRQPAHILLLNLALNEFFMCATYLPINIISGFAGEYIFGSNDIQRCHVCQTGIIFVIFLNFGLHILAFISLDRFLFFRFPFQYTKYVTIKTTVVTVVLLWIFCIVISIPPLFGFGEYRFTQSISTCSLYFLDTSGVTDNVFYEVFAILEAFVFPVTLLVVTSVGMITIVCKQLKKIYGSYNLEAMGEETEGRLRREKGKKRFQVVKVYGAIMLSNLLTWSPNVLNIAVIFAFCERPFRIKHEFFISNYLLVLSSVVIHPLLQTGLIPEIRRTLTAPFRKKKNQLVKTLELSGSSFISLNKRKKSRSKQGQDSEKTAVNRGACNGNGVNGLDRTTSPINSGPTDSRSGCGLCRCCVSKPQPSVSNKLATMGSPTPSLNKELEGCDLGILTPTSPSSPASSIPSSPVPPEST